MKSLSHLISDSLVERYKGRQLIVDDQTVFFAFRRVIRHEYGHQGEVFIEPFLFKNNRLFVRCSKKLWESEVWISREDLASKVNEFLGSNEVKDIIVKG